jgi:diaminopimelate epimerase
MEFFKSCSGGNDFLLVDEAELRAPPTSEQIQAWCDRHHGAGADGLVVFGLRHRPVSFRIYNADGQEAELSGNGMAGLTALLAFRGLAETEVELETRVGRFQHRIAGFDGGMYRLEIDLGSPDFQSRLHFPFLKPGGEGRGYSCRGLHFYPVCIGNPQVVLFTSPDRDREALMTEAEALHRDPMFPRRTNVSVVGPLENGRVEISFFERGVGPTESSSTGTAGAYAVIRAQTPGMSSCIFVPATGDPVRVSGRERICIENRTRIVYKGLCLETPHA